MNEIDNEILSYLKGREFATRAILVAYAVNRSRSGVLRRLRKLEELDLVYSWQEGKGGTSIRYWAINPKKET